MICSEKKDRFTVSNSNGNGALTYPVGLLTADENILAGIIYHKFNTPYFEAAATSDSYLWNWKGTWTMSPYDTKADFSLVYFVNGSGYLSPNAVSSHYNGLRPAISLKHDILIQNNSADGTLEHPYVVIDGR